MLPRKDAPHLTPENLDTEIARLCDTYPELASRTLGKSILGRRIPLLLLGRGKRKLLYVATHHATEWLTSRLLLCFIEELADGHARGDRPYGLDLDFLLSRRMLCFIPMLNPDGVAIHLGKGGEDPLAERRAHMVTDGDFSHWQANARGVDLNHNYGVGFFEYKRLEKEMGILGGGPTRYSGETPESEPETAALCGFIRTVLPAMVLSLHTQGEEIYYRGGGVELPRARRGAYRMAALSGYRVAEPTGPAVYGGLCDWTTAALGIPSYTLECGKGENPLPPGDAAAVYLRLRRLFFESITM